ncbi:MAG: Brp/Blh family beta-carotene 15,15'-dioxygenase [Bacteroidota bacterium]
MKANNINSFAFLTTLLLLVGVILWDGLLNYTPQIFLVSIFLVGIPHGAVDHLIFFKKKKVPGRSLLKFYSQYIGLIFIVGIVWYFFPGFSFLTFLVISAYHFGQSQLYYFRVKKWFGHVLYLVWGIFVLSSIILFNFAECQLIFESFEWFNAPKVLSPTVLMAFYLVSGATLCVGFIGAYLTHSITSREVFFETLLVIILIVMSVKATAVFTFTVYFGLWHSFKSLILEYEEVKTIIQTPLRFILALLPFTLMALIGLIGAYYLLTFNFTDISPYMVFIVIISALTVPHLLVMDKLYGSAG